MVIELILTPVINVGKMSSTTRHLKNAKKSRKAISPVIATVILVAVAVVIAAAMAGFAGSLFGSYSQNSQVQIRSATLDTQGNIALDMVNKGASPETVTAISIPGKDANNVAFDPVTLGAVNIPANGEATVTATANTGPLSGQHITLTVTMNSGSQYTISTVVS